MEGVRRPGPERRREIAGAVVRIIGQRGLGSFTMTTLAREVGVTSGALFRHFPTREAMLREAVRHAVVRVEGTFPDRDLPPLERVLGLAEERVHLLRSDPGIAWLLRSEEARLSLPEGAVRELRGLAQRSKRCLLDALKEGAADGSVRSDIPPEILVVLVMGAIHVLGDTPGGVRQTSLRGRGMHPGVVLGALRQLLAGAACPARPQTRAAKKKKIITD